MDVDATAVEVELEDDVDTLVSALPNEVDVAVEPVACNEDDSKDEEDSGN